ncbi:HNH endonuclease family protein [Nocardioides sp.]|uniref:HNH endonuclease family protein n=1 Tax=Nocardioides sp. TaxID=35761 RepID=UPI003513AF03
MGGGSVGAGGRPSTAPSTTPPSTTPTTAPPSTAPPSSAAPADALARLRPIARTRPGTYERSAFGSSWADVDGNGCNQRDDVLLRDAVPASARTAQQGRCDHDVLAGSWVDPYTGRRLTFTDLKAPDQAQAIQIDHVVPLSEAWASGADRWSEEQRRTFANDLDNLLAVDGPTNASKSDGDPAAWRPRKGYQCAYATRWITVKSRYDLGADASEVAALRQMLDYC